MTNGQSIIAGLELSLHVIANEQDYKDMFRTLEENLKREADNGQLNKDWAIKAYYDIAVIAARDYFKKYKDADTINWYDVFPSSVRSEVAHNWYQSFEAKRKKGIK